MRTEEKDTCNIGTKRGRANGSTHQNQEERRSMDNGSEENEEHKNNLGSRSRLSVTGKASGNQQRTNLIEALIAVTDNRRTRNTLHRAYWQ